MARTPRSSAVWRNWASAPSVKSPSRAAAGCAAPRCSSRECPLLELAQAAHHRWPIEDCFLRGKQEVGLDDYEVRGWRGFHHHMTLVMLAMWFLVLQARRLGGKNRRRPDVA